MNLPPRFRESAFRRYEPYIAQAVKDFPGPTKFVMTNLSSVTFSNRLRDAITSLMANSWTTTVNIPKLRSIEPTLQVSDRGDSVWVGDRATLSMHAQVVDEPVRHTSAKETSVPSINELESLLSLVNNGVLSGPFLVSVVEPFVASDFSSSWEALYPNLMVVEENGRYRIV